MWVFSLLATAISVLFFLSLLRAWRLRRSPQLLAWTMALFMFSLASAAVLAGTSTRWTTGWFRVYYLFGAIANVPVLALGTLYLLTPRRFAHLCAISVGIATIAAAVVLVRSELAIAPLGTQGIPAAAEVVPDAVRLLSRVFSFAGFFVVVGGAVWSGARLGREKDPHLRELVVANSLIATGTSVVAVGSVFARYGRGSVFAAGLAVGVALMFVGFLRTRFPATRPLS